MLLGTVTPVLEQWCAACLASVLIPGNSQQLLRTALHLWEDAWRLAGEASWGNTGFPTVALLEIQHFILIYWWYLPSLKIQMFYMPKPLDKRADSRDREWNAGLPPLGWVSARCVCVQTFCLQDGPLKFPTSCISFSRRDQERWSGCWSKCSVGEVLGWVLETMEGIAPALQVRQSASFKHLTPHQYPCRMKGPGLSTAGPNPSDEHTCIHVSLSWEVGGEVLSVPERAVPASQASCGPGMGNGGACGILGAAGRQNVRKWALHVSAVCVMRLLWWFLEALVALFSLNLGLFKLLLELCVSPSHQNKLSSLEFDHRQNYWWWMYRCESHTVHIWYPFYHRNGPARVWFDFFPTSCGGEERLHVEGLADCAWMGWPVSAVPSGSGSWNVHVLFW